MRASCPRSGLSLAPAIGAPARVPIPVLWTSLAISIQNQPFSLSALFGHCASGRLQRKNSLSNTTASNS